MIKLGPQHGQENRKILYAPDSPVNSQQSINQSQKPKGSFSFRHMNTVFPNSTNSLPNQPHRIV
jgi:hypothetical protein